MTKHPKLIAMGKKIRMFREALGVSQELFAELSGLDRAYFGGVERGERNVSVLNLIRIAKALRVQVGDLFPKI